MCIKVEQDERQKAQMLPRMRNEIPAPSTALAAIVDMSLASVQAGAALLWPASGEVSIARGPQLELATRLLQRVSQHGIPEVDFSDPASRQLRASAGVDLCPTVAALAAQLELQSLVMLGLRDGTELWAWLAWIDLPPQMLQADARSAMCLTAQTLNEHRRVQVRAERAIAHAQRLEDVAYACGDWMWETDERHRYTWVLRDSTRESADPQDPRVGQIIPDAPTVDWLGRAPTSPLTLHGALDRAEPLVRLVVQEMHEAGVRYVSRSAVPLLDAKGAFRGYRGSMRDVTQSVEAKAQMWLRDERLRRAALALPGAVVHASGATWMNARLDDHSGRLTELLALEPGQTMHSLRRVMRQLPRAERRALLRACADCESHGRVMHRRLRTNCDAPAARWIDVHATSEHDAAGRASWSVFVTDVTAHVSSLRQIEQLQCAKDKAEASCRDKSALVSKVSHELKTPLNAILGLAQLIQMKHRPDERAAVDEWIAQIARAGWHMTDVIDTLMEFGRVGSGGAGILCEPADVRDAIEDAIRIIEREARQRSISIVVDAPQAAIARCDRRAIRQVFINLLSNAVKYNTEGGRIWIALRCADPITITVRDSGPGLTAEQIGRLFQPFERLGAERRGIQGNGLGLLICKELVEAMGGSIDVHSVAGQGCTFAVSLMAALPRRSQSPEAALRAA